MEMGLRIYSAISLRTFLRYYLTKDFFCYITTFGFSRFNFKEDSILGSYCSKFSNYSTYITW